LPDDGVQPDYFASRFEFRNGSTEPPLADPPVADPPGAAIEAWAESHLVQLTRGMSIAAVAECARAFVRDLAAVAGAEMPSDLLHGLLERLRDRLKACGYTAERSKFYINLYEEAAGGRGTSGTGRPTEPAYMAILPDAAGEAAEDVGLYRIGDGINGNIRLTNFAMFIDEDVSIDDGAAQARKFRGRIVLAGREAPIEVAADDYASDQRLQASIFSAIGAEAEIYCRMWEARTAVSAVSRPRRRTVSADFGWSADGTEYRTPTAVISAESVRPVGPDEEVRIELADDRARHLGLTALTAERLTVVRRHIVDELLAVHDRRVTLTMLAATALAMLLRFAGGLNKPAVWLVGLTGCGKSFLAGLFASFFGHLAEGIGMPSWASTPNSIERLGYDFRDALYTVDDYKPEVTWRSAVIRILQSYADGAGRGRLRSDATANVTRPIRGLLVSTGEDCPDHSASAQARVIVVDVPHGARNLALGDRCRAMAPEYAGVTADFIRWLLAGGHTARFATRVAELRGYYVQGIIGEPNDIRIAGNIAQLAAAGELFAAYLSDLWPEALEQFRQFASVDLIALRDRTVTGSRDEQESKILCSALADLIESGRVQVKHCNRGPIPRDEHAPFIGGYCDSSLSQRGRVPASYGLNMSACLAEVNTFLREQGRPEIRATHKALLRQLREDGLLLDSDGQPLSAGPAAAGDSTVTQRIGGAPVRVFRLMATALDDHG
jgi:hypothetical protein